MFKARSRAARALAPAAALAVTAVTAGCDSSGAVATPKIRTTAQAGVAPTPPGKGAYFGAWVSPTEQGGDAEDALGGPGMAAVTGFERGLGRSLDIVQTFHGWKSKFPDRTDTAVAQSSRYLLLTWSGTDTREIVRGEHDTLIRERARAVKALGKPVFLRWQRDMDRESLQNKVHSAGDYVAAWKHIRTLFTQEKVANVAWVWCPTAGGFASGKAESFYPGDDQVDWICADVYPGADFEYRDLSEPIRGFLEWVEGRPKPIMVAEFGVPRSYGERRAEWLRKAAQTLQHPQVKAVVYFNSNENATEPRDERRKYSVTDDRHAVSALREFATVPYFNPRNLPVTGG
ncbi:glycoside hydrolase family 26 protein [Actinomadura miaoliensis]|uniref:GH26 domain-containing protein n=1 Tax=Actinomadura miaoliensis TaxID=430685 RepID=A0ABP7WN91_9ACTN